MIVFPFDLYVFHEYNDSSNLEFCHQTRTASSTMCNLTAKASCPLHKYDNGVMFVYLAAKDDMEAHRK